MTTAFVSRQNGVLTVRLPENSAVREGVVDILVEGNRVVLTPSGKSYGEHLVEILEQLDIELPDDPPPQDRPGL